MSVGKDSILRAANADARKTEAKTAEATTEVKAEPKAEAKPAVRKTTARKTTAAKKTTAKTTSTRKKAVKTSVLTPQNSEELQAAFVTGGQPEKAEGPVQIKEELPVYLL